jgi:heavy metal sensor kinase
MTIRIRLTLYLAAVLAAILLGVGVVMLQFFQRQQWSALDAALLEEAETVAEQVQHAGLAGSRTLLEKVSDETDIGPGRRILLQSDGKRIFDYGDQHTIPPPFDIRGLSKPMITGNRDVRFAIAPLMLDGRRLYLQNGVNGHLVQDSIDSLRNSLLLILPLVLGLCVAGGYWLAGRALGPMASVTAALNAIQPSNLHSRLPVSPVPDEIARLSAVINALLERLERASATERRFASDAAHELRTPLAVLRTGLEVALARERSPDQNRNALTSAHREVLSLCRIADELLMLARLNGEVSFDRSRVNLRDVVAEVVSAVEPLAQSQESQLRLNAADDVVVNGNAGHLRRLLVNLLDNALKFTPAHGSIDVTLARKNGAATLSVADTGPGIPARELPFIFDRFFRGASSPGKGSGLGLSFCKEIARLHGGEIAAATRPTGGCEFIVTLPLAHESRTATLTP